MSVLIIVERRPADKQGPDISDPLISSDAQAMQLGRYHIDKNATNRFKVSGSSLMCAHMSPGSMIQVTDLQKGNYMGMLLNFSSSMTRQSNSSFSALSATVIEREV